MDTEIELQPDNLDVASIVALVTLCKTIISSGAKAWNKYRKKKLLVEEKELLLSAFKKQGEFHYMSVNQIPHPWIKAGGKDFPQDDAPQSYARYLQAFKLLCMRGYVDYVSGILFVLTPDGFQKAKDLENGNNAPIKTMWGFFLRSIEKL
jgi:hypothetical protein